MNKTAREIELEKKVAAGLRCEKIHLNRAFRAEKKLEIAVKALKFYAEMENVECFGYCGDTNREHYLDIEAVIEDGHTAQQALKEIEKNEQC